MTDVILIEELQRANAMHLGRQADLEDALAEADVDVLRLDGSAIDDADSLMARVAVDLDLPEDQRPSTWDGLSDVFWAVLGALDASRAVLVWTHAERLMRGSMHDLVMAVTVLTDLARSVETTATGFPRPLRFSVVLLGDDPAFDSPR